MKKRLLNLLLFLIVSISFVLAAPALSAGSAKALSENLEGNSLFFVDIESVRVYDDKVFVYDRADSTIKILDKNTGDFIPTDNNYTHEVEDMLFYKNVMMLYNSSASQKFACVNLSGLSDVEFDYSSLTALETAKSMQIVSTGEKDYLVICPSNPVTEDFEVAEISLDGASSKVTINKQGTFKASSTIEGSVGGTEMSLVLPTDDGKLVILLCDKQKIVSISFDPDSFEAEQREIVGVSGLSETGDILNLSHLEFGETSYLAVTTAESIQLYTINTTDKTLSKVEDKKATFGEQMEITKVDGCGSIVAVVSNSQQTLKIYDFSKAEGISTPTELKNPDISFHQFDKEGYVYLYVNQDIAIKDSPYAKSSLITASEGENLAIIGEGRYALNDKRVENYDYVLYTKNGRNYYGYIENRDLYTIDLSTAPEASFDAEFVSVMSQTIIYSLPSTKLDSLNTKLGQVAESGQTRLKVLSNLYGYFSVFENDEKQEKTTYLMVQAEDDPSLVGFIDASRVLGSASLKEKVICNATVIRDGSFIFKEKDDKSEVLDILDKGARVKVIGKRDTITNLTHVVYNDEQGNEIEGYIYTYNLEADTWNMVQMLGMLLIVINIILLVVIVVIKNRLTK